MSNSKVNIKTLKNTITTGLSCQFLPLLILGVIESFFELDRSLLDSLPKVVASLIAFIIVFCFFSGYIICWIAAPEYAKYKGYSRYFGLVGILSIFGLAFLFLLKNKNSGASTYSEDNPFEQISISAIFIGYISIAILFMLTFIIFISSSSDVGIKEAKEYFDNENISSILNIPLEIILVWYTFTETKRANLNLKQILGSFKKINYKLPVGLAIVQYFFAWGFNRATLYFLSFIVASLLKAEVIWRLWGLVDCCFRFVSPFFAFGSPLPRLKVRLTSSFLLFGFKTPTKTKFGGLRLVAG